MIEYSNECCDCAVPGYPCIGSSCRLLHYPHFICDECKDEVDELYKFDGEQLCGDCVLKKLEVVEAYE